jgi:hypothetical protein
MYKMVIQAVLLSGAAIFFIATKSDGLRAAATSGDFSAIARVAGSDANASGSGSGLGGLTDALADGVEWAKYDPRQLWQDRPKTIKLSPKTIRVDPEAVPEDRAALLAAHGLDPSLVTVVKLD